jgi:flagellar FliL protein
LVLVGTAFALRIFAPGLVPFLGGGSGSVTSGNTDGPKELYPLEVIIVNLLDPSGKRYLKVAISLELGSPPIKERINANMTQIRDKIIVMLSGKTYSDISTPDGKNLLREEIKMACNKVLDNSKAVTNVFFTDFVVQ